MENQETKVNELQEQLNNSKFKMCADCTEAEVVVYVTEHHLLLCDKKHGKNQLVIPFAVFRENYEKMMKDGNTEVTD